MSEARFSTYLSKADGNEELALELYRYNIRLASSFLFPLGVTEVVFRNAVDDAFVQGFGVDWHLDVEFRRRILTRESLDALERASRRARSSQRDKVVAELTFDFWSNVFRSEYGRVWRTRANIAFPHLPHGQGRHEIQRLAREINQLRNRVAHHEPILDVNVPDMQAKMIGLTGLRCPATAAWLRFHSTVGATMRTRPRARPS